MCIMKVRTFLCDIKRYYVPLIVGSIPMVCIIWLLIKTSVTENDIIIERMRIYKRVYAEKGFSPKKIDAYIAKDKVDNIKEFRRDKIEIFTSLTLTITAIAILWYSCEAKKLADIEKRE